MSGFRHLAIGSGRPPGAEAARHGQEAVEPSRLFRWLVRVGFLARAITYGVIGILALALALRAGTMGAAPSQQGALALIARSSLGRVGLVVISAGLLAYALRKLVQGIRGRGLEGGGGGDLKDRVANVGGGLVYLGFSAVAIRTLTGTVGNASSEQKHAPQACSAGQVASY